MGFLDFLGPALTTATQAAGAYQGAEANASAGVRNAALQSLTLARQQHEQQIKDALTDAQTKLAGARTTQLEHPAPVIKTGPNGTLVDVTDPTQPKPITGGTKTKVVAPDGTVQFVDPTAPPAGLHERGPQPSQDHFTFLQSPGADGKPVFAAGNTRTGAITPTAVKAKPTGTGAGTGPGSALNLRAKSYVDLMTGSYPTMEQLAPVVRPRMIAAAFKYPTAANGLLNEQEQAYIQAARDFIAGVLHQESGARLTDSQLAFGVSRYIPTLGDSPATVQRKLAAAQHVTADRQAEYGAMGANGGESPAPTAAPTGAPTAPAATSWRDILGVHE